MRSDFAVGHCLKNLSVRSIRLSHRGKDSSNILRVNQGAWEIVDEYVAMNFKPKRIFINDQNKIEKIESK